MPAATHKARTLLRRPQARKNLNPPAGIDHAVRLIYRVCCLAGSANLIADIRAELAADGVVAAIRTHDTAVVFDWLMAALSYQGIADRIASSYMDQHGRVQWRDIRQWIDQPSKLPAAHELLAFCRLRLSQEHGQVRRTPVRRPMPPAPP